MGNYSVTFEVRGEFTQYVEDVELQELEERVWVGEGIPDNSLTILSVTYDCDICNEEDYVNLVKDPAPDIKCPVCGVDVCSKCFRSDDRLKAPICKECMAKVELDLNQYRTFNLHQAS